MSMQEATLLMVGNEVCSGEAEMLLPAINIKLHCNNPTPIRDSKEGIVDEVYLQFQEKLP